MKNFLFLIITATGLSACVERSILLVHPQSGEKIQCSEDNAACLQQYEAKGYSRVDKTTAEERSRSRVQTSPGGQITVIQGGASR